jgi:hypothetical protein
VKPIYNVLRLGGRRNGWIFRNPINQVVSGENEIEETVACDLFIKRNGIALQLRKEIDCGRQTKVERHFVFWPVAVSLPQLTKKITLFIAAQAPHVVAIVRAVHRSDVAANIQSALEVFVRKHYEGIDLLSAVRAVRGHLAGIYFVGHLGFLSPEVEGKC